MFAKFVVRQHFQFFYFPAQFITNERPQCVGAGIIITPSIIFQALLLALSTTLLASIYPAWRASRLVIVDALRHNR